MYDFDFESREGLIDMLATLSKNMSDVKSLIPQLQYHQAQLVDQVNANLISTEAYADLYWQLELEVRDANKHLYAWEAGQMLEIHDNSEQLATVDQLRKRLDLMRWTYDSL